MKKIAKLFLLSLLLPHFSPAWACENQFVRDVAFQEDRDIHRLSVILRKGDASGNAILERLQQWLSPLTPDLNLELHTLYLDDPAVVWNDYGLPSAPPSAPVVVLSGYRSIERSAFYIDHWEPEPNKEQLALLETSPVREFIARQTAQNLAVLLYVPANRTANTNMDSILEKIVDSFRGAPLQVSILEVDRRDTRERTLLSFLGIKPEGEDFLAVVFGRGKVMPPLRGGEITEVRIREQLAEIQGDCSCLRSTLSLGADIPMLWSPEQDRTVVTLASLSSLDDPTLPGLPSSTHTLSIYTVAGTAFSLLLLAVLAGVAILWRRRFSL